MRGALARLCRLVLRASHRLRGLMLRGGRPRRDRLQSRIVTGPYGVMVGGMTRRRREGLILHVEVAGATLRCGVLRAIAVVRHCGGEGCGAERKPGSGSECQSKFLHGGSP